MLGERDLCCILLGCQDFNCLPTNGVFRIKLTKSYSLLAGEQISPPRDDRIPVRVSEVICRSPSSLEDLVARCGFLRQTLATESMSGVCLKMAVGQNRFGIPFW